MSRKGHSDNSIEHGKKLVFKDSETGCRISADIGGTFTDIILMDDKGNIYTHKLPSSPPNYEQAVLDGIAEILKIAAQESGSSVREVTHGTTVATNAVLEHKGAITALITTKGFRDVFEIRRLRSPQLFNLFFEKPRTLVKRHLRFEISERISATGEVLTPLCEDELFVIKDSLKKNKVESVAVCLLHSYAFTDHERRIGQFLKEHMPDVNVSLSCDILKERKEYERTATTVVNSYILPTVQRYLTSLNAGLKTLNIEAPLQIMQSAGGLTPDSDAANRPVYILESGPAAGVLAARYIAAHMGLKKVITFDMGGTTAKASLIENDQLSYSPEYEVASTLSYSSLVGGNGELIRIPTINIAETGAGGGSIAYIDSAGSIHVGPESAGALPGPVCYRKGGTEPTLTDANVVLGYIKAGKLASGDVDIDIEAARRVINDCIAKPKGLTLFEAAAGIHQIANASTMRALKAVSTHKGRDPREFTLLAFGGSGPIQGANLARDLQVAKMVVPPIPGLFSAAGMLFSDVEHHDIRSCGVQNGNRIEELEKLHNQMRHDMVDRFLKEGYGRESISMDCSADIRYKGQYSEIRIDLPAMPFNNELLVALREAFEREHELLYGHKNETNQSNVEIVALRMIGRIRQQVRRASLKPAQIATESGAKRLAYFGSRFGAIDTPVISRKDISGRMQGPLLVEEYDSTIVIPPDMSCTVDGQNNVIVESVISTGVQA
jgi:N-methylhydantoinase A